VELLTRVLEELGEGADNVKLQDSPRRLQFAHGASSSHFTRRRLQCVQPFRDFLEPTCAIVAPDQILGFVECETSICPSGGLRSTWKTLACFNRQHFQRTSDRVTSVHNGALTNVEVAFRTVQAIFAARRNDSFATDCKTRA